MTDDRTAADVILEGEGAFMTIIKSTWRADARNMYRDELDRLGKMLRNCSDQGNVGSIISTGYRRIIIRGPWIEGKGRAVSIDRLRVSRDKAVLRDEDRFALN